MLDGKTDSIHVQIALGVVDVDVSFADLIGLEDVLFKSHTDAGGALIDTAPG